MSPYASDGAGRFILRRETTARRRGPNSFRENPKLADPAGSIAQKLESALSRVTRQTRPAWLCLACGVLLYGWMFACLALLSILVHDAVPKWRGARPQLLRSLDAGNAPVLWLTHHLAILGTLGLLLAWLRLRAPARALAIITAVWSGLALAAFLGMWLAFFHRNVAVRYPLDVGFAFAFCAMFLSLICSTWYAANGNKTALVFFVCLPLVQLAAFHLAAPAGLAAPAPREALPWFFRGQALSSASWRSRDSGRGWRGPRRGATGWPVPARRRTGPWASSRTGRCNWNCARRRWRSCP